MTVIHRFKGNKNEPDWEGVDLHRYSAADLPGVKDVTRRILIGPNEESDNFHIRYFEIQPGGNTPLDQHAHEHGVIILRGQGRVRLSDEEITVNFGDALYIPGNEVHQFFCAGDAPFGFLCVVPAKR